MKATSLPDGFLEKENPICCSLRTATKIKEIFTFTYVFTPGEWTFKIIQVKSLTSTYITQCGPPWASTEYTDIVHTGQYKK